MDGRARGGGRHPHCCRGRLRAPGDCILHERGVEDEFRTLDSSMAIGSGRLADDRDAGRTGDPAGSRPRRNNAAAVPFPGDRLPADDPGGRRQLDDSDRAGHHRAGHGRAAQERSDSGRPDRREGAGVSRRAVAGRRRDLLQGIPSPQLRDRHCRHGPSGRECRRSLRRPDPQGDRFSEGAAVGRDRRHRSE